MVATPDEMTANLGCFAACSRGSTAWNSLIGPLTLTSTCSIRSDGLATETSRKASDLKIPALAITMSRWVMPWFLMVEMAFDASVSEVLSILTVRSLLPSALLMLVRSWASWPAGLRAAATTVVFGLERYFSTKPRPRPCRWMIRHCRLCGLGVAYLVGASDQHSGHGEGEDEW
jgi:hypothetical protein